MPTPTTTYSLSKPTVGGDDNTWGTEINNNLDKLDDLLDGTLSITPNLASGWEVGGVAVTATAAELNILDGVTANKDELNLLDGVALTVDLNYVDGVTSNIQTQLNAKQPLDADLTAIAALTPAVDRVIMGNGTTWTAVELPSSGILAVNAAAPLSSSGGTSPTISLSGTVAVANGGTGATTATAARANLGAQATITGAATTIDTENLTASRALVSDGSGKVAVSSATAAEVGALVGLSANVQTQLDGKASTATQLTSAWQAGTSTTETIVSPAKVKAAFNASGSAPVYACRAWVNFNGTGTVAIRASGNVSSITDLGVGSYRANFATAMQDTNYAAVSTTGFNATATVSNITNASIVTRSTSSIQVVCGYQSNSGAAGIIADCVDVAIAIFR